MAGLYLHIPFCRKACYYCNFHFSTSLAYKDRMLKSILREIELRKDFFDNNILDSIYFGGGTPSVLTVREIKQIIDLIKIHYRLKPDCEITFEVNPDDIIPTYLDGLLEQGVNRLSVGIQSFFQKDLEYMNRSHTADQSRLALEYIKKAGFRDFSLDLIYGGHTTSNEMWEQNVESALHFAPNHLSAYCMTIEPKTVFGSWNKKGKLEDINEEKANQQFEYLTRKLKEAGYIHYEISNFALPDHLALHNSNYWKGKPYLGIGPSAHSYLNEVRTWNIANNATYMDMLELEKLPLTEEKLSLSDRYNEHIMTRLRTIWGVDLNELKSSFGEIIYTETLSKTKDKEVKDFITIDNGVITLTQEGKIFADAVAAHFFMIDSE